MPKTMLWSVMHYLSATERLLIAAERGCVKSVRNLITEHAANPYSKDSNGMTALHFAARDGHLGVCEYLVAELNANATNTRDKCEQIEMQSVDQFIKVQKLEYIVENIGKRQLDEKNDAGHTALFLATLMGVTSPVQTLAQRKILEAKYNPIISVLTNAGARVTENDLKNCKDRNNQEGATILRRVKTAKNCQQCPTSKSCSKNKL